MIALAITRRCSQECAVWTVTAKSATRGRRSSWFSISIARPAGVFQKKPGSGVTPKAARGLFEGAPLPNQRENVRRRLQSALGLGGEELRPLQLERTLLRRAREPTRSIKRTLKNYQSPFAARLKKTISAAPNMGLELTTNAKEPRTQEHA